VGTAQDSSPPPPDGFPVEIARSYNSFRSNELGDFGYGWKFEGTELRLVETLHEVQQTGDSRIEVEVTLPDGREFVYANEPANPNTLSFDINRNAWARERAFVSRPYGQMLWLPGYRPPLMGALAPYYPSDSASEGYRKVAAYRAEKGMSPTEPDGTIGCLKARGRLVPVDGVEHGAVAAQ